MMKFAVLALLPMQIFSNFVLAAANAKYDYEIKNIQGGVFMRSAWELEWRPVVVGTNLVEGTLIHVELSSSLMIEGGTRNIEGLKTEAVRVTVKGPIVFRLSPSAIREIQLNSFFFERLPSLSDREISSEITKNSEVKPWLRAWQWLTAIAPKDKLQNVMQQLSEKNSSNQSVDLAVRAKRIKLLAPLNNTFVMAERFPYSIKVLWVKTPLKDVQYEVRLWPSGSPRGAAITLTKLNYYYVTVEREGDYFIQISALDAPWHSDAIQIHVAPSKNMAVSPKDDFPEMSHLVHTKAIHALLPPDEFELFFEYTPRRILFSWEMDKLGASKIDGFEVVVYDRKDHEMTRVATRESFAEIVFTKPGQYRWRVHGLSYVGMEHQKIVRWITPEKTLKLRTTSSLDDVLSEVVKARGDQITYVDFPL